MAERTSHELFRPGPHRTAKEYLFKAIFTNDQASDAVRMIKYIVPGTCVVDVVAGGENLSPRTQVEERKLKKWPASCRLACQTTVNGPVSIVTKPDRKQKAASSAAKES